MVALCFGTGSHCPEGSSSPTKCAAGIVITYPSVLKTEIVFVSRVDCFPVYALFFLSAARLRLASDQKLTTAFSPPSPSQGNFQELTGLRFADFAQKVVTAFVKEIQQTHAIACARP
jgi:hypothetical protein